MPNDKGNLKERYRSQTVLVVEDSAYDVELLQLGARLAPEFIAFHIVQDGEQALAYLKGEGQYTDRQTHPLPDLVLLDLSLPGMSGFEVLSWIRQQPEFRTLKVFVWTDSGDPEALDRAINAGVDRFVPKSVLFVRGGAAGLVHGISVAILGSKQEGTSTATDC